MVYGSFLRVVAKIQQSRLVRLAAAALLIGAALPQTAFAGCAEVEAQTPYSCTSYGYLDLGTVTTPLVIPNMNDMTNINLSGTHKKTTVYVRNDWTTTFAFAANTQGNFKFIVNPNTDLQGMEMILDFTALNTPIKIDLRSSAAQTVAPGLRLTIQQSQKPAATTDWRFAVLGTRFNDILLGSQFGDTLIGMEGNDFINSFNANFRVDYEGNTVRTVDFVSGYLGNDVIITGNGNDDVLDGKGDDIVKTGQGNDNITLGAGSNVVELGQGDDTLSVSSVELYGTATGIVDGGQGNDRVILDILDIGSDCAGLQAQLVSFAQNVCAGQ